MASLDCSLAEAAITGTLVIIPHPYRHNGQAARYRSEQGLFLDVSIYQLSVSKRGDMSRGPTTPLTAKNLFDFSHACLAYMYQEEDRLTNARYSTDHIGFPSVRKGYPGPPGYAGSSGYRLDENDILLGGGMLDFLGLGGGMIAMWGLVH